MIVGPVSMMAFFNPTAGIPRANLYDALTDETQVCDGSMAGDVMFDLEDSYLCHTHLRPAM
jgi:hypothetical protein